MNNLSLFGAIKVNGLFVVQSQPFFTDVNPGYIESVQLCRIKDASGVLVQAFQIKYQNPKGLTEEVFYLQTHTNMTTLSDFLSGLQAINAKNTFTIFTDLERSSDQASSTIAANTDVLLNDDYYQRQYVPRTNQTLVTINVANRLNKRQLWFAGDQTIAGSYYYFYNTGN
jgi:hypothetical protein